MLLAVIGLLIAAQQSSLLKSQATLADLQRLDHLQRVALERKSATSDVYEVVHGLRMRLNFSSPSETASIARLAMEEVSSDLGEAFLLASLGPFLSAGKGAEPFDRLCAAVAEAKAAKSRLSENGYGPILVRAVGEVLAKGEVPEVLTGPLVEESELLKFEASDGERRAFYRALSDFESALQEKMEALEALRLAVVSGVPSEGTTEKGDCP